MYIEYNMLQWGLKIPGQARVGFMTEFVKDKQIGLMPN